MTKRSYGRPSTWAEVYDRLASLLCDRAAGEEWIRQALEAQWGVADPADLDRGRRGLALQKVAGVLLTLQDVPCDLAFDPDVRSTVAAVFARFFGGAVLAGPPWRLSPGEDLPPYATWVDHATGFDAF